MSGMSDNQVNNKSQSQQLSSLGGLIAVTVRELDARILSSAYLWSTLAFIAVVVASPFLIPNNDEELPSLAVPPESMVLIHEAHNDDLAKLKVVITDSTEAATEKVYNGEVDAYITNEHLETDTFEWLLVGKDGIPPSLVYAVQDELVPNAVASMSSNVGLAEADVQEILRITTVQSTILEENTDRSGIFTALGMGLVTVIIVLVWGATMSSDVVQEKTTRVVEVLISTIRPWQLLAGKVLSVTIAGILQMLIVLVALVLVLQFKEENFMLPNISNILWITGILGIVIGVPLLATLMAAMAARVDNPDDLGMATQPVYLLLMVPYAAVVFISLKMSDSVFLEILSLLPVVNIFAMPVRVAIETVPAWQLLLSLILAVASLWAAIWFAAKVYSNSILRSGGPVSILQALKTSA